MEKFIKENKNVNVIVIVAVILGFLFYWFQLRPTFIKKNCSQFTEVTPADVGITKEQADINKETYNTQCNTTGFQSIKCWLLEKDTKERAPTPKSTKTMDAIKSKYDLCLRQHGL